MLGKQKGITLIALVITIVVLLILAGVTVTMLLGDNGIITKAQKAKEQTERDQQETEQGLENLVGEMNVILKTPIDKTTSYVGYYADFNADGTPEGVIFADLAKGNTGGGTWYNCTYSIPQKDASSLKEYYVSKTNYEGTFGPKDVISPVPGTNGEDRFYAMALTDEKDGTNTNFYFYYNAYPGSTSGNMTDYADTTETDFGSGKTNTLNMLVKWKNSLYGDQNARDVWNVIKDKVGENSPWFMPSIDEWAAFGGELKMSNSSADPTYYSNLGIPNSSYMSSSQANDHNMWVPVLSVGNKLNVEIDVLGPVRLAATF